MRIYTRAGDLAFKAFTFPDGQPHFKLETDVDDDSFHDATIETAIRSFNELGEVLLARDVLGNLGYRVSLDIRYLLGARMDRALSPSEPFTLQTVARLLNGAGFQRIRILDAHSEAATRLIRNSTNMVPWRVVQQAIVASGSDVSIAIPDNGAVPRVLGILNTIGEYPLIYCLKKRDTATGNLLNFSVQTGKVENRHVLIVDDICDGGGTFVGLAKELRKAGATKVSLFVTHGIFSKGLPLEGIDRVFTTNSYCTRANGTEWGGYAGLTVIPISMKDLK